MRQLARKHGVSHQWVQDAIRKYMRMTERESPKWLREFWKRRNELF